MVSGGHVGAVCKAQVRIPAHCMVEHMLLCAKPTFPSKSSKGVGPESVCLVCQVDLNPSDLGGVEPESVCASRLSSHSSWVGPRKTAREGGGPWTPMYLLGRFLRNRIGPTRQDQAPPIHAPNSQEKVIFASAWVHEHFAGSVRCLLLLNCRAQVRYQGFPP